MADQQNGSQDDKPVDDLAKKLADAEKQAAAEKMRAHSASAQDEDESGSASSGESELTKMTELAKRTMADFQNFKRRQDEERRTIITMANADLIRNLIPIIDNLDRAKQHVPAGAEEWFKGIEMCTSQLHKTLNESGVKPIESVGQPFNPDLHEALAEGPGEKNIVTEELEKGYMLGERVIRHAKVKVGQG
ncbi:nucleotide exchange factor GrpE [Candidatus Peregrinibacteria bacterium]|nr:nucleotide exchange factor GrpE [Candidatus Peregrinibacteria bacterium]